MKAVYPSYTVGDVAKELGKRWEVCQCKPKYEVMAGKDKKRYEAVRFMIISKGFQNCSGLIRLFGLVGCIQGPYRNL